MDIGTLLRFEDTLRQEVPDFEVRFKNESLVQKILGVLSHPFNPGYMTSYTSTYGNKVYFPSRDFYTSTPGDSLGLLAHEFTHMWDEKQEKTYKLKYMLPQALAVIPMVVFVCLAGWHAWILLIPMGGYCLGALFARESRSAFLLMLISSLALTVFLSCYFMKWRAIALLGLAVAAPWPASWRTESELRGYGMDVGVQQWLYGYVSPDLYMFYSSQFVGPAYYYMSRNLEYVQRSLEATRQQAQLGALQRISPYNIVHDFLYREGLTRRSQGVA